MLIHVQITTFWLQRKVEQRKQRQATNNMNKLKMFETKQVTLDLTKNLNPFFLSKG
jgi:DNA-binding Xre family transcriptional regulator